MKRRPPPVEPDPEYGVTGTAVIQFVDCRRWLSELDLPSLERLRRAIDEEIARRSQAS
jgi:hypothetical protein